MAEVGRLIEWFSGEIGEQKLNDLGEFEEELPCFQVRRDRYKIIIISQKLLSLGLTSTATVLR